jgi:transcriptional regulator with PAS, ATPase and Fis domain
MDPKVIHLFCGYAWPGNVRQLQNVVERLVVLTEDQNITEGHVLELFNNLFVNQPTVTPRYNLFSGVQIIESQEDPDYDLKTVLDEIEKYHIETALRKYKTTRKAANHLNMSQPTLVRRLKELNISQEYPS